MTTLFLEEIILGLRAAVVDAEARGYVRGVDETMQRIQQLVLGDRAATKSAPPEAAMAADVSGSVDSVGGESDERKRAPKGLVRKVITRELKRYPGMTPLQIAAKAENYLEKMIADASYRSELRKGRNSGHYREEGGKWFLAGIVKAEDGPESDPSAFN